MKTGKTIQITDVTLGRIAFDPSAREATVELYVMAGAILYDRHIVVLRDWADRQIDCDVLHVYDEVHRCCKKLDDGYSGARAAFMKGGEVVLDEWMSKVGVITEEDYVPPPAPVQIAWKLDPKTGDPIIDPKTGERVPL